MIADALKGEIAVVEKEHILAVYRDQSNQVHTIALTQAELALLQELEDGPKANHSFLSHSSPVIFQDLVRKKLILDITEEKIKL
jgi:hypothetical protein